MLSMGPARFRPSVLLSVGGSLLPIGALRVNGSLEGTRCSLDERLACGRRCSRACRLAHWTRCAQCLRLLPPRHLGSAPALDRWFEVVDVAEVCDGVGIGRCLAVVLLEGHLV